MDIKEELRNQIKTCLDKYIDELVDFTYQIYVLSDSMLSEDMPVEQKIKVITDSISGQFNDIKSVDIEQIKKELNNGK